MNTPDKRVEVKQDSASTYEIRVGSFVKGGIFAHDLGKFLTDTLTKYHQDLVSEVVESVTWYRNNEGVKELEDNVDYIKVADLQTIIKSK